MTDAADGVRATARAVFHLRQVLGRSGPHLANEVPRRLGKRAERCASDGSQRHAVEPRCAELCHPLRHSWNVVRVDPGDQDRVDLHEHSARHQGADPRDLSFEEQRTRLATRQLTLPVAHPAVDGAPNLRVHGVDRDRDVAHLEVGKCGSVVGERQSVGGNAEEHVGMALTDPLEGCQRGSWGRQRVTGAGDADDTHRRVPSRNLVDIFGSLVGRQQSAGHPGAALVRTVETSVAEVALNIAAGGHWKMDTGVAKTGSVVEAGVRREVHAPSPMHDADQLARSAKSRKKAVIGEPVPSARRYVLVSRVPPPVRFCTAASTPGVTCHAPRRFQPIGTNRCQGIP